MINTAEELARRRALDVAIERVILGRFRLDPGGRIRRGVVQEAVRSAFGLRENRRLASRVIRVLSSIGIRPVVNRGRPFFNGLSEK
jgi:hypothetical protein